MQLLEVFQISCFTYRYFVPSKQHTVVYLEIVYPKLIYAQASHNLISDFFQSYLWTRK